MSQKKLGSQNFQIALTHSFLKLKSIVIPLNQMSRSGEKICIGLKFNLVHFNGPQTKFKIFEIPVFFDSTCRYIIEWQLVRLDIYPPGVWWSTPGSASPSASCDTAAARRASGPRRPRRGPSAARAARAAPSRTSWGDMAWRIFYRMIVILFSEDSQNFWRSKYQV